MKKKKIFVGLNNVASVFKDLTLAFGALGYNTLTMSRFKNTSNIINNTEEYNLAEIRSFADYKKANRFNVRFKRWWIDFVNWFFLRKAIFECDIFVFISDSFTEDFSDLELIKRKGKKIVFVFVGDDARWYNAMKQEFKMYNLLPLEYTNKEIGSLESLTKRISKIRNVEKYADFIFSRLDQAQLQIRPYYRWNMMVWPTSIGFNTVQRVKNPIIVHAPSDRLVKGTKYILAAIEKLKNEGFEFQFKLIENMSNEEAVATYSEADILVDQLLCPGTGKLSTEALASGTIVLSNMSYGVYPQKNPEECPIIDVNAFNIYETLKSLILDYPFREKHALLGRPYVEKYLSIEYFCKKVLALVNGESIEPDYIPEFYKNHYKPESLEEEEILKQWDNLVKDEPWFQ